MLYVEWNMDDYGAVRFEEGREEGLLMGREKGLLEGREEGIAEGREEGLLEGREDAARKALAEGASVEFVQRITGLDIEQIKILKEN